MDRLFRFVFPLLGIFAAATLLTSCGESDTHESITQDTLALMEEVAGILEGVKDEASAEAAAEKLDRLAGNFEALANRLEVIGEPEASTVEHLKESYRERQQEAETRIMSAMTSLENPDLAKPLRKPIEEIGNLMVTFR